MDKKLIKVLLIACLSFVFAVSLAFAQGKGKGQNKEDRPQGWEQGEKKGWQSDVPPGLEKKGKLGEDEDDRLKGKAEGTEEEAEEARESFVEQFWNPNKGHLHDVVKDGIADSTLRPNQLIAVSLDFSMLDRMKEEKIVDAVWKSLWGTYGLKTLPETDPRYTGNYLGDWNHRDSAYHNGTVWTWLLGPFTTAFLKTKNHTQKCMV